MTDAPTEPPKERPKPKRNRKLGKTKAGRYRFRRPGAGRKPMVETVKVMPFGEGGRKLRFTFSEDVVVYLVEAMAKWFPSMRETPPVKGMPVIDRFANLRIQIARLMDISIPAVFVRIEPPTYHPAARRLIRRDRRFTVDIKAKDVGVVDGLKGVRQLEILYDRRAENMIGGGVLVSFPDEWMIYDGKKKPVMDNKTDLTVPRHAGRAEKRKQKEQDE